MNSASFEEIQRDNLALAVRDGINNLVVLMHEMDELAARQLPAEALHVSQEIYNTIRHLRLSLVDAGYPTGGCMAGEIPVH